MAVIGTFGSFTAARLGIYASQSSLNVTGNNIANINTKGYTRQRLDLVSLHSAGNSRYANGYNLDIGYGVLGDSVSQLRDPYLDIRYRDEQSSVGAFEARLKGLQQLSSILDEVGQGKGEFGIIEAQFNDFLQQLQQLNKRPNDETYDTTVRSSAESLVDLFHSYSEALTKVKDNQLKDLQGDVKTVNTILTKIRDEAPAKYGLSSNVKNSLVADGCIIEGTVENSIIFRGVKVGQGAVVKNSIVMQGSVIDDNAQLDYVILDKDVLIKDGRRLAGYLTYPVYVPKKSHI